MTTAQHIVRFSSVTLSVIYISLHISKIISILLLSLVIKLLIVDQCTDSTHAATSVISGNDWCYLSSLWVTFTNTAVFYAHWRLWVYTSLFMHFDTLLYSLGKLLWNDALLECILLIIIVVWLFSRTRTTVACFVVRHCIALALTLTLAS